MNNPNLIRGVVLFLCSVVCASIAGQTASLNGNEDAARLAAVRKLLRDVPLIDGHNDAPWTYRKYRADFEAIDLSRDTSRLKTPMATDIPRLRSGGVGGLFWSVYVPATLPGAEAVQATLEQIDLVHRMCARYPDAFELALRADDVERIYRQGKIASLIGVEGGHSINNSLAALRMLYRLGARYLTLTHTRNTDWADAVGDEPKCRGLTAFGEQVVVEMNRLGMLVDLSHVTDETMRAALRVAKAPVIFSHASVYALCNHPRNVPDDVLRMTASNGGVVMVCFLPGYLTEVERVEFIATEAEKARLERIHPDNPERVESGLADWRRARPKTPNPTLSDVADHIDHIRKVAGIGHVGIGSDYEGFHGAPDGLEDVSKYPALLVELMRRGYTRSEIKKVAGQNMLRVMRAAERVAAEWQRKAPAK